MLAYMLDTDICIYLIKDKLPALRQHFKDANGRICMSTVTLGELKYGAEKSDRRAQNFEALERFADRMPVLPFDEQAAAHYGELRAALARAGTPCGPLDTQIGAHARSRGLIIVTNNRREFDRMPGLRVENWV
ncbi:plasmid maintenance protein [Bosea sp. AAP35]|uniref:type II toxin-antitoxin system tRNA(fMet)-specific endonuclease VapC n=1 Tax=Bosea sp. AAP35 TaxID=1523417 RepID=UPI0006B9183A|nr:type II toxin-antitoxin system VapC family toxin [Bosea sp. AAP35]KPF65813.1 plasmid maintenance protein [Bosea sp. AAP35]